MNFINKLTQILENKHITDYKFCKDLGLSKNSINHWKNGSYPTIDKLEKIITYLEISPYDLLEVETKEKSNNLTELEEELLHYFRVIPERDKLRYIGKLEDIAEPYLQETKSSTWKTG